MPATKIVVNIPGETPYDVRVGADILDELGSSIKRLDATKSAKHLVVISDTNVAPLYLDRVKQSLVDADYRVSDISVPAGETSKSLAIAGEIYEALAGLSIGRDGAIVALGGGVVGDLAGFVASTYVRGIPVVQVPTSLLAMVDASVGGKTAVNLQAGKNMVGTFTQPVYVCASTETLSTLDDREWQCGCAEIAKMSVIDSDEFFFWLLQNAADLSMRDETITNDAIVRSVVFKADVVAQDKTETCGVRECLNYGHTLAHAIERLAGYGTYSHGAAVAQGMRFSARLALRLVDASQEFVDTQDELLDTLGLERLAFSADPQSVVDAMKHDKKVREGVVRFVLPKDVGVWELVDVADEIIYEQLCADNLFAKES